MLKRKDYVDYIKAIAIILVIIGHTNFANSHFYIKQWIYAFHIPVFFFATGLVMKKVTVNKDFIVNKLERLIIPYLLWGLVYSTFSVKNCVFLLWGSYESITRAGSLTSLWFLVAMFIGVVLATWILSSNKYLSVIAMLIVYIVSIALPDISIGYPWCLNSALMASAFILLGFFFEQYIAGLFENSHYKVSYAVMLCVSFCATLLFKLNMENSDWYVLMAKVQVGNPLIFTIVSVMGCVFVYFLAKIISKAFGTIKPLSFIGKNTLVIFAIQKPIIAIFGNVFARVGIQWYLQLLVTCVGILIISCIASMVINRYIPALNGR